MADRVYDVVLTPDKEISEKLLKAGISIFAAVLIKLICVAAEALIEG